MPLEKLQFNTEPPDSLTTTIKYDEIIIDFLNETEQMILYYIANGVGSIEDLSSLTGLKPSSIRTAISAMRTQGIYFIFYDNPLDNMVDQYLITTYLPPTCDRRSARVIAAENCIEESVLMARVQSVRRSNPNIYNDYQQNLTPELVQAGYTIDTI